MAVIKWFNWEGIVFTLSSFLFYHGDNMVQINFNSVQYNIQWHFMKKKTFLKFFLH